MVNCVCQFESSDIRGAGTGPVVLLRAVPGGGGAPRVVV